MNARRACVTTFSGVETRLCIHFAANALNENAHAMCGRIYTPLYYCLKQTRRQYAFPDTMSTSLHADISHNRLLRAHLLALRIFGYAIFDHQAVKWAHNARGILLTLSFAVFNVTQVRDDRPAPPTKKKTAIIPIYYIIRLNRAIRLSGSLSRRLCCVMFHVVCTHITVCRLVAAVGPFRSDDRKCGDHVSVHHDCGAHVHVLQSAAG